ncbi:uncharacterized protein STEHIDRAFT_146404 [Stereum hirsutum FP-91666 SS1]|uniref:uncharacterized protein n=1 Tax=Stereum hirsutum (strain FP-91666) TaxID=721885 RepID=UPI000440A3E7|nr:uncharacterized protein STEHIDRAFT_146404 [Stereum hirsutum FP-91666 SS1]EIM88387.1 hypothetical protein STEHIDRAFT_146404 [Stereum hirsutum FP-91666 SS1]
MSTKDPFVLSWTALLPSILTAGAASVTVICAAPRLILHLCAGANIVEKHTLVLIVQSVIYLHRLCRSFTETPR